MNTQHTPGPWVTRICRDGIYAGKVCLVTTQGGTEIVGPRQLGYPTIPMSHVEGNARLIAAAPELLDALDPDALEAIADELSGTFQNTARAHSLRVIANKQRAAITKATGEAP